WPFSWPRHHLWRPPQMVARFTTLAKVLLLCSCVKIKHGEPGVLPLGKFEDMVISQDFKWQTSRDVTITILSDLTSFIEITSVDGKTKYHRGLHNTAPDPYVITVNLPSNINAIKINGKEKALTSQAFTVVLSAIKTSESAGDLFTANIINFVNRENQIKQNLPANAQNPISAWSFNESSGDIAYDSHSSNNGLISNALRVGGIKGNALYFNGINSNVNINHTPQLAPSEAITMMAWIYPEENRTSKIFQKGDWDGHGIWMDLWKGWSVGIRMENDSGNSVEWGSGRPILNEWYHLAMTYNGSVLSLYINGTLRNSKPVTGKLKVNSRNLSIGSDNGVQKFFKGKIDDVMIFGVALTPEEIRDIVQISNNPDSDGDGIPNGDDAYPNDPDIAFENYFPANGPGTLAFEDMWPAKGDYDFNDLVLDYRFKILTDGSNFLSEVLCSFTIKAIGAQYANGFGFQINSSSIDNSHINITGGIISGSSIKKSPNGTESGQNLPTIIVFNNANGLMSPSSGFGVNVHKEAPYVTPVTVDIKLKFAPARYTINDLNISGFNPFIYVNGNRGREVHLPDFPPTSLAASSFFGSEDDNSSAQTGKYYKSKANHPWAINITSGYEHTIERIQITDAYLKFAAWAQSSGQLYPDWYMNKPGYRYPQKIF
ncbi:MAG: LruC domain-containing protein, partial [Bacteroidales bacterium]|nr:LruC domain-containing protein [Bacteroidales bacterium]